MSKDTYLHDLFINEVKGSLKKSDGGSGGEWITVCDVTLTEEVSSVEFNTDVNGKPFNLTEVIISAKMRPNTAGSASTFAQLHAWNEQTQGWSSIVQPVAGGVNASKDSYYVAHAVFNNGTWETLSFKYKDSYLVADSAAYSDVRLVRGEGLNQCSATKLRFSTTVNFGVGTRIYIYGR